MVDENKNELVINEEIEITGRTTILKNSLPEPGQYWLEKKTNKVRLISKIKYVDNFPHTIYIDEHPEDGDSSTTVIVYTSFINKFSFVPDGVEIREQEIANLNKDIAQLQQEMTKLIAEPLDSPMFRAPVKGENLPVAPTRILSSEALGIVSQNANSEEGILKVLESGNLTSDYLQDMKSRMDNHLAVTTVKNGMLESSNKKIFGKMKVMGRFFKEKAQAELAKMQSVQTKIQSLNKGIQTLSLYLGEGVQVTQLCEGERTKGALPLYLFQAKRFIDEEIAVFTKFDNGEFDCEYDNDFYTLIKKNPAFVNAMIPVEKGLVIVSWRRYYRSYNDRYGQDKNDENTRSWLLFRDGECVWAIDSPILSHNHADTLFSTEKEMRDIFKRWGDREITYDDTDYTDALEKQEAMYLHYKRFAIMLSGLHDREEFLGELPVDAHNGKLFLPSVQEKVYVFVRDAEKDFMLGRGLISYSEWISQKNAFLRQGSRVALWANSDVMNSDVAPGAWPSYQEMTFYPDERVNIDIVSKKDDHLTITVPCTNNYRETQRNVLVYLDKMKSSREYLCLDTVTVQELSDYIHDRASRSSYMSFLPLFKDAKAILEVEEPLLQTLYSHFSALFEASGIVFPENNKDAVIKETMRLWRVSKRHIMPPKLEDADFKSFEKDFCDVAYSLIGHGRNLEKEVEELVVSMGRKPLRLVVNGKNQNIVYTTISDEEKLPVKTLVTWVAKFKLRLGKTKLSIQEQLAGTVLLKNDSSETTLYEWNGAEEFISDNRPTYTLDNLREVYIASTQWKEALLEAHKVKDITNEAVPRALRQYRSQVKSLETKENKYFSDMIKRIPVGFLERDGSLDVLYLGSVASRFYLDGTRVRERLLSQWYAEFVREDFFKSRILTQDAFGFSLAPFSNRNWKKNIITEFNAYGATKLGRIYEEKEGKTFTDFVTDFHWKVKNANVWFADNVPEFQIEENARSCSKKEA